MLFSLFTPTDLWLCGWNQAEQGRAHQAQPGAPEGVQGLQCQDGQELDAWHDGEKPQYESSKKYMNEVLTSKNNFSGIIENLNLVNCFHI